MQRRQALAERQELDDFHVTQQLLREKEEEERMRAETSRVKPLVRRAIPHVH